jgi:FAD-linked sulfhydryl oxidase
MLLRTCQTEFFLRLCFVHNQVNERLKKPIFDCAHLDEEYDCGCGDDGNTTETSSPTSGATPTATEYVRSGTKDEITGAELIKGGR